MRRARTWLANAWNRRDREVAAAYRALFDAERPERRLVLADLAAYCNVGVTSFVPGDPHQTALNEGRRDAFLHLAEMLALDPAEFPSLLAEVVRDRAA